MKKIYLMSIVLMMLMAGCQKESPVTATEQKSPKVMVAAPNQTAAEVWVLPSGFVENKFYKEKENQGATSSLGDASLYCGGITTVNLHSGNTILGGSVQFANDANNLYVTFQANVNWYFAETELYVGKLSKMPHTQSGEPSPGRFPYKSVFSYSNLSQSVTYTIPLTSITKNADGSFIIVTYATILKTKVRGTRYSCEHDWYDDDDDDDYHQNDVEIVGRYSAWGAGTPFFSNWGCSGGSAYQTYIQGVINTCNGGGGSPGDFTTKGNTK
jgi:hypothetical protein